MEIYHGLILNKKHIMKKLFIIIGIALMGLEVASAQTADELKAERQQMKTEMTSKDAIKKAQKIEKKMETLTPKGGSISELIQAMVAPFPAALKTNVTVPLANLLGDKESRIVVQPTQTGINSVDGLVNTIAPLLAVAVSTNDIMTEYKTEIVDNGDGEIDITKYKANAKDYLAILPLLSQASLDAAKATEQLKSVQNDVKNLSPTQVMPATKSVNWSVDALDITNAKLTETTKLLQNLINSLKATGNL